MQNNMLKVKVDKAIATGNSFILSFTVFLAILREGFEIVLFYAALIGSGIYNTIPVFVGATVGAFSSYWSLLWIK